MIVLTIFQSDWRESQICQFLSLKSNCFDYFPVWLEGVPHFSTSFFKSDYFDHFPVWLERASDSSISFFKRWLFWQVSSLTGGSSICRIPQRRIASWRVPPRTQLLYLGLPRNRNRQEKSKYWKNLGKSSGAFPGETRTRASGRHLLVMIISFCSLSWGDLWPEPLEGIYWW